jgi:hypothetical protein
VSILHLFTKSGNREQNKETEEKKEESEFEMLGVESLAELDAWLTCLSKKTHFYLWSLIVFGEC